MKPGQVVLWYGLQLKLVEYVSTVGINIYWYGYLLNQNQQRIEMYSFRKEGHELSKDHIATTHTASASAQKEVGKRKRGTWLNCPIKHLRRRHRSSR